MIAEELTKEIAALRVGDRVKVAAHSDEFMRGVRYAKVTGFGRLTIRTECERTGKKTWLAPSEIAEVMPAK